MDAPMSADPSGPLEQLQGRLDAFREIHEHWELNEAMTEAEFDQWLHNQMREQKQAIALLSALPHPQQAEIEKLRKALVTCLVPLEGLHMAVEWELAPSVKTTIAHAVTVGRAALAAVPLPSDPRQEPRSAVERLQERWEKLRAEGLLDLKVWAPTIPPGTTLEELAEEMLAIFDAYERRDFTDVTHKLDAPSAFPAAPEPHPPAMEGVAYCAHCDWHMRYEMGSEQQKEAGLKLAEHAATCLLNPLVERVQELEAALAAAPDLGARLEPWLQHHDGCMARSGSCERGRDIHRFSYLCEDFKPQPCTCGLDAVRASMSLKKHEEKENDDAR